MGTWLQGAILPTKIRGGIDRHCFQEEVSNYLFVWDFCIEKVIYQLDEELY